MIDLNINTNKLRECGQDIIQLEKEYVQLINELFNRIEQVPTVTEEWLGVSSLRYSKQVGTEKEPYLLYGQELKRIGDFLVQLADDTETIVNKTEGIQ